MTTSDSITTAETTDRELIARAIRDAAEAGTVPDGMTDPDEIDNHIMGTLADAVLAAIGPRLLPEVTGIEFDVLDVMVDDAGRFNASLRRYRAQPYAFGTADTLANSIRNALEGTAS